jgi:pimeloyl-ACP methyl ester carboxylesterase
VVLVHGSPSWSYLWRNVAPELARHFTVHVYDLLGYGDSEKREGQDVSIAAQGRLLAELLGLWELEAPAIAGHDIGGAITLRAHLREGVQFGRIALIDAVVFNPWNTPTTMHIRAHLDAYRTMPAHIYEEVVAAHLRTAVYRSLDDVTLAGYLAPWQGEAGQTAYFRKVAQIQEEKTAELEPRLGSIAVPTLILWGARDTWLVPTLAERLRLAIPGSELKLIPEAGHFVMEDAPSQVAHELIGFFTSQAL